MRQYTFPFLIRLTGLNRFPPGAKKVMTEELEAAGAPIDFQLVSWEPEPNPKSYNPTQLMPGGGGKKRSLETETSWRLRYIFHNFFFSPYFRRYAEVVFLYMQCSFGLLHVCFMVIRWMNIYPLLFGPTTKDPSSQTCFSLGNQAFLERAADKALTLAKELKLNKGSVADAPNVLAPTFGMSWDAQDCACL